MREIEKLDKGLEYHFNDAEVAARKAQAAKKCQKFNEIPAIEPERQEQKIREILGSAGENISFQSIFNCDDGKNIHVGNDVLTNYNLTILDIAPVTIGNHVMIGPNVDIYTVNHPMSKQGRREYLAKASPVKIGNDVWIGGKVTITPGVTIGNNVVVASGAVVTKDIPSNTLVAGVPAKIVKELRE
ncbi:sugar O-acetyltransferase [Staphylococcus equorum]